MKGSRLAALLCALVLLSGCGHDDIAVTAEPFCQAVVHVCISREDQLTDGTAQQIEANNLGRDKVCTVVTDPCAQMRTKPGVAPAKPAAPKVS